jgi:hypothetical protein
MSPSYGRVAAALALLVVLAGCTAPMVEPNAAGSGTAPETKAATPDANFSDPSSDVLGWEDGYWYNESIDVNQSDGLSDAELETYVARAMARVEYVRQKEFKQSVPVSVLSRAEYRNRSGSGGGSGGQNEFSQWNNQVWEAMFVSGESEDSQEAISTTRGSSVAGFYSPRDDEIKIITDSPDSPTINNATLVHELVHALQDQHYDLTKERYSAPTQDGSLAVDGAVEGDAKYVEIRYAQLCEGTWRCVATPAQSGGAGGDGGSSGGGPNLGVLLTIFQPYSDGPVYVKDRVEKGGMSAVDELMRNPPESTEQVIHLTDESPRPIDYQDRSRNGWSTFPKQGESGSDTLGEASMYAMFWYQARTAGADTVDPRGLTQVDSPYDTYDYDAEPSNGWANDRLFPYKKGEGDARQYGYVWVTEWDTQADAKQFRSTYLEILSAHDATKAGEDTWVIESGPFADAFRVTRDGKRVTIVNAPQKGDLDDVRRPESE